MTNSSTTILCRICIVTVSTTNDVEYRSRCIGECSGAGVIFNLPRFINTLLSFSSSVSTERGIFYLIQFIKIIFVSMGIDKLQDMSGYLFLEPFSVQNLK